MLTEQVQALQATQQRRGPQATAQNRVADSLQGVGNQLSTIQTLAGAAIGDSLLSGPAGDVAKTVDTCVNLQAKFKLAYRLPTSPPKKKGSLLFS